MRSRLLHPVYPANTDAEPDTAVRAANDERYDVVRTPTPAAHTPATATQSNFDDDYDLGGYAGI